MRPRIGDELHTTVIFGMEVNGVTIITAQTYTHNVLAVETQMKIYINDTEQ